MHVLGKLEDELFALFGLFAVLQKVILLALDFGLLLGQFGAQRIHLFEKLLEDLFEVPELVLEGVDLIILGLQTCSHFLGSMGQNMLRLSEVLDLKFVLVKVSGSLFQLLNDFLVLLVQQLNLFFLFPAHPLHVLSVLLRPLVVVFSRVSQSLLIRSLLGQ